MPTRRRPLNHEPVHLAVGAANHGGGQGVRGDDGQKLRTLQRRHRLPETFLRVEAHQAIVVRLCPADRQGIAGGLTGGKSIQHTGNLQRNSRAHQDVADSGQHGAINGSQQRKLQLLHAVDSHRVRMAFARQRHFHKVGDHKQLGGLTGIDPRQHRNQPVRSTRRPASGNVMFLQNAFGHGGNGKQGQAAAHMSARIAVLQSSRKNRVQGRAGYNPELPGKRNRSRQPPIGNARAHAALDQNRMMTHPPIVAGITRRTRS